MSVPWEDSGHGIIPRFLATMRASLRPMQLVRGLRRDKPWIGALTFGAVHAVVFSLIDVLVELARHAEHRSLPAGLAILAATPINNIAFVCIDTFSWTVSALVGALLAGVRLPPGVALRGCAYTIWPWFAVRIVFDVSLVRYAVPPLFIYEMFVLTALSQHHGTTLLGRKPVSFIRALAAGVPVPACALGFKVLRLWGSA
jgi:hypothetical protein